MPTLIVLLFFAVVGGVGAVVVGVVIVIGTYPVCLSTDL
jgi:hypothetical protein